ncbi:MAG TPA: efflux RND transporter permease subunit, partial [Bacteroidia bacterium]|nr:efflux RND transporter permease subunit [Bacteroidia bacterium]
PNKAAIEGTKEIFFAVVSTSVTLAAVFLPVVFMEGFVGRLFREFGVVIAGAVLISAFVSLTLTPMLNARLVRKDKKHSKFYEKTEPFFQRMNQAYENSLKWFMEARWRAWTILGSAVALIFILGRSLPSELSPLEDRNWLRLLITAPEGASYEYTDNFIVKISDVIEDSIPEKNGLLTVTAPGFTGAGAVNSGFARIVLTTPDKRERSQQEIADQLSGITRKMTDARVFVLQEQSLSAGGSRSALPVQFVLQNQEFDKLREVVPAFLDKANKSPVFQGVDVNLKFNKPELNVSIDRAKANALGVSVDDIAQTLQLAFSGQRFGYFIMQGKQYQVIGQVDRENRDVPYDLSKLYVKTNSGGLVQLDNLIEIKEISSPPQLYHFNRYQSATISAGLAPGYTIGDGINEMKHIGDSLLDESFSTDLTGPSRDFAESSSNVWFAFVLAIILIYLVLAAQFESFVDPFIIMITVPLAICGALISLWYFNQTLNIFSQIGIIMLIGLVTKNGILIVEFINQLREKGVERSEAIIHGSVSRFRPILMTSLATSLGALPIALALGAGAKSRMSMGIVIVGGVLFSLIFTLYIIPAMYSVFSRKKEMVSYD